MLTIQSESEIRDIVRLALLSEGVGDPETGASTEVGFARLFKDSTKTSSELLSAQAVNHMSECVIRPIQFTMTDEELEEMEGARDLLETILSADRTGRIISPAGSGTYTVASTGMIAELIQRDTRLDSQAQAKLMSECLVDKMLVVMRLISGIIKVREDATLAQMRVDEQTKIEKAAREGREVKRSGDSLMEEAAKAKVAEQAGPLIDARKRLSSVLDRMTSDYFASMAYYGNVLNAAGAFEFVGGQPNAERLATDSFERMDLRGAHSAYASLGRLIHPSYSGKSWHDINSSKGTAIDDKERVRQDKGFIQATINTFERLMYSLGLGVSRGVQGKGMPKPGSIPDVTLIINMADEYNAAVAAARRAATGSTMVSASNVLRDFSRMNDAEAARNASDAAARSIGAQAAMSREEAQKAGASRVEARPDVQSALRRRAEEEAAEEAQRVAGGLTAGEARSAKSAQAEVEETLSDGLRQVAERLDGVGTGTLNGATSVDRAHNAFIRPIALAMSRWCDVAYLATASSSRGGSRKTPAAILSQQQSESPEATGRILEDIISLSRADRSEERDDFFSAGLPEEEQVIKGVAPTRAAMRLHVTPREIAAALRNVRLGEGGVSIARNLLNDKLAPYVIALGKAVLDARQRSGGGTGEVDRIKAHFSAISCGNIAKLVKELNDQIVNPRTLPSFTITDPIKYLTGTPLEPVRFADVAAAESQHVSEEEVAETSAYRQAAEEFGETSATMSATADEIRQGIADARRAQLDSARPVQFKDEEYEDPFGGPIYRGSQHEALALLQQLLQERAKKAARR